jgi:hypothetical protein
MKSRFNGILCCLIAGLCLALTGCGGVEVERQGVEPLKLLDLSPRPGEQGVPVDADVVAVFSASIVAGEGGTNLNEQTFYVMDAAESPLDAVVTLSDLDPEGATAIIRLEGLAAGQTYTTMVAGSLEGEGTEPLGFDIQADFNVAQ